MSDGRTGQQRLEEGPVRGVYRREGRLYTVNAVPGTAVYGEPLVRSEGVEYRAWDPYRSKLAAAMLEGVSEVPLTRSSNVLYLGAASGTTASHVSDIASEGVVYCVEVSQRSFRDLLRLCEARRNMMPIQADAGAPSSYEHMVSGVDLVYQDIAQRDQADMFLRNMRHFDAPAGMLMVKARSIDVNRRPAEVFSSVRSRLAVEGLRVSSPVDLSRYAKDHAALVVGR